MREAVVREWVALGPDGRAALRAYLMAYLMANAEEPAMQVGWAGASRAEQAAPVVCNHHAPGHCEV